jgi:SAM-dependent methyltransferase
MWIRRKTQTQLKFERSDQYWKDRYKNGGNSGAGSYSIFAEFKAEILNAFVEENAIQSVIEFGSGDGNQLTLATYPRYLGVDISPEAVALCEARFQKDGNKAFITLDQYADERGDLSISLDVIYHLVEDGTFHAYMHRLFDAALRYVIIYSSNTDENSGNDAAHVRHRHFSAWIDKHQSAWVLDRHLPNCYPYSGNSETGSFADFFIYKKIDLKH